MTDGAADAVLRLELFVEDIERSARFYEDVLGFRRETDDPAYVAVRRGGAVLGLGRAADLPRTHPLRAGAGERSGLGVEIVIEVDDVEAVFAGVQRSGWPVLSPLAARPWGLRDFRVSDPDGYYLRLTSR